MSQSPPNRVNGSHVEAYITGSKGNYTRRNPLLIGSTVLTESGLLMQTGLNKSQSPPNRVNGSHLKNPILPLVV